jgi:hypothetical protein
MNQVCAHGSVLNGAFSGKIFRDPMRVPVGWVVFPPNLNSPGSDQEAEATVQFLSTLKTTQP